MLLFTIFFMQRNQFVGLSVIAILLVIVMQPASAQYDVSYSETLYDWLESPTNKKQIATNPEAMDSGIPSFAADGILGVYALTVGVFGGISTMFFIQSKKGKYASMGRD